MNWCQPYFRWYQCYSHDGLNFVLMMNMADICNPKVPLCGMRTISSELSTYLKSLIE